MFHENQPMSHCQLILLMNSKIADACLVSKNRCRKFNTKIIYKKVINENNNNNKKITTISHFYLF